MSGFDAEWYLRRLGENMLLGFVADDGRGLANLKHATAALVAVGAIEPTLAGAVVSDYGIAHAARHGLVEFELVRLALSDRRPIPRTAISGGRWRGTQTRLRSRVLARRSTR